MSNETNCHKMEKMNLLASDFLVALEAISPEALIYLHSAEQQCNDHATNLTDGKERKPLDALFLSPIAKERSQISRFSELTLPYVISPSNVSVDRIIEIDESILEEEFSKMHVSVLDDCDRENVDSNKNLIVESSYIDEFVDSYLHSDTNNIESGSKNSYVIPSLNIRTKESQLSLKQKDNKSSLLNPKYIEFLKYNHCNGTHYRSITIYDQSNRIGYYGAISQFLLNHGSQTINEDCKSGPNRGGILIVTAKKHVDEWASAISLHSSKARLLIYTETFEKRRKIGAHSISQFDFVITTFDILKAKEVKVHENYENEEQGSQIWQENHNSGLFHEMSILHLLHWQYCIIDHNVLRNIRRNTLKGDSVLRLRWKNMISLVSPVSTDSKAMVAKPSKRSLRERVLSVDKDHGDDNDSDSGLVSINTMASGGSGSSLSSSSSNSSNSGFNGDCVHRLSLAHSVATLMRLSASLAVSVIVFDDFVHCSKVSKTNTLK